MTTKWARTAVLRGIRTSPSGEEREWYPCFPPRLPNKSEEGPPDRRLPKARFRRCISHWCAKCNADKQQQIFPISIKFVVRRDDCTCITKHQYYYPSRGIQTHRFLNITTIKEWSLKNFFIPTSYNRWNRAASPEDMRKRKDNNYNEYNNKNINWIPFKNALNCIFYMPKYLFLSIFLESSVISFYCLPVS